MRGILLCALLAASSYPREAAKWRAEYERALKAPDGWLSLVALEWLHPGMNRLQTPGAGSVNVLNGKGTWIPGSVKDVSVVVIERGGKLAARIRNSNAASRLHFTGTRWFAASEAWRVKATWVAYPKGKTIPIVNILGMKSDEPCPGYAEFNLQGRTMRLEPVLEENQLFFMFRDMTNARETYGAGRFLYAPVPKGNQVELDFNQAHNPPCAYTAFATCPLPPKQNTLPIAVEAGEKSDQVHK